MGDWHFPEHYTEQAKDFARASRVAEIDVFRRLVVPAMRAAAREVGYAIGEHGSMARDADFIAVPWTDEAADVAALVEAVRLAIRASTGWGHISGGLEAAMTRPGGQKPHGRLAFTIIASGEINVDLSVMPRLIKPELSA